MMIPANGAPYMRLATHVEGQEKETLVVWTANEIHRLTRSLYSFRAVEKE